jgi:nicotinate-nucleotide adenylyltransferase
VKLAILGGTFNPVHRGHLNIAAEVRTRFSYDRIIFIPANIPAHKTVEADAGAVHRLKMVELAVAHCRDFMVDDCELRRGGTSYTIDTVRDLSRRYPVDGKPGLIIGDDLVQDFETWQDVEQLVEEVDLIIAHRQSPEKVEFAFPCRYIDNSLFPISSSQIRDRLRSRSASALSESVAQWLPSEVIDYIQRHDLYN